VDWALAVAGRLEPPLPPLHGHRMESGGGGGEDGPEAFDGEVPQRRPVKYIYEATCIL